MLQLLRAGLEVNRHPLKGVYVCSIGKKKKQVNPPTEVLCTLFEGQLDEDTLKFTQRYSEVSPIELSYQGQQVTLRPWESSSCMMAAAISNRLIQFPVRPRTCVLALDCTLHTLTHFADIVGPEGRLFGIISSHNTDPPSPEDLRCVLKRYPQLSVVLGEIQEASLDSYKNQLSLSSSSKYSFLMGLHPRLGAASPARKLLEAAGTQQLCRNIFSFLECDDFASISCLVVSHWPPNTTVDVIREVVLTHINIIQRWRTPVQAGAESESGGLDESSGHELADGAEECPSAAEPNDSTPAEKKRSSKDLKHQFSSQQWVVLDLPTDNIASHEPATPFAKKLGEVLDNMKRFRCGKRTGLLSKELLLLQPHFANRALLLLKYATHCDERSRKAAKLQGAEGSSPAMASAESTARLNSGERALRAAKLKARAASSSAAELDAASGESPRRKHCEERARRSAKFKAALASSAAGELEAPEMETKEKQVELENPRGGAPAALRPAPQQQGARAQRQGQPAGPAGPGLTGLDLLMSPMMQGNYGGVLDPHEAMAHAGVMPGRFATNTQGRPEAVDSFKMLRASEAHQPPAVPLGRQLQREHPYDAFQRPDASQAQAPHPQYAWPPMFPSYGTGEGGPCMPEAGHQNFRPPPPAAAPALRPQGQALAPHDLVQNYDQHKYLAISL